MYPKCYFDFFLLNWKRKFEILISETAKANHKMERFFFHFQMIWKLKFNFNPCIESMIRKSKKLWNMNLNFIFRFFEIQILISIWVPIKIETKLEFMKIDCDVKEPLLGWWMFILYYVWFYSINYTLNDDSSTSKIDCVAKEQLIEMFQTHQHDYRFIDGCFHKTG